MKKLLLLVLIPLVQLCAQPVAPAMPDAGTATAKEAHTLWTLLDLDRDGALSAAELTASHILIAALVVDDDGSVSLAELRLSGVRRAVEFGLLYALDANRDGVLQPLEIVNAESSLKRLDRNGDGIVSRNESRGPWRSPLRVAGRTVLEVVSL